MKLAGIPYSRGKLLSLGLIALLMISSLIVVPAMAGTPPTIPGHEDYMEDYGVLHNDTYILYPWEEKSVNIGFSKYGEKISNMSQGLEYDGVDVFANAFIEEYMWSNGWVMDIHYTDGGILKNIWAYALYTDWSDDTGIGGPWRQGQNSTDGTAPGDTHGGRRTSGWAESDPIRLIYDGPRKSIHLLRTTIYDKDPADDGSAMVELTIQLVFNKVKKYVMQIKDVKRVDDSKFFSTFQIEFSERAEWDLDNSGNPQSYAEFYNNLTTKYNKHPFYNIYDDVTYDLCQMINVDEDLVGFAAFWPNLISKWVQESQTIPRSMVLDSLETFQYELTVPDIDDPILPNMNITHGEKLEVTLPYGSIMYPRGAGVWDDKPWVFKKVTGQWQVLTPADWAWDSPDNVTILWPAFNYGDDIAILYKRERRGAVEHHPDYLDCMPEDLFKDWPPSAPTYGMYIEPMAPYVIAEWDFDLDYNIEEMSTHQFRCVSVYGLTDNDEIISKAIRPRDRSLPLL